MAQVSDEFAVLQTLYRFTQAQDRLDLATMASLMVPGRNIKFDLTKHFPEVGTLQGNAAEMSNILYEASAGWTATQHPVYNPVVTIHGEEKTKATIRAMVQAYHCLEKDGQVDSLTVWAIWIVEMEKLDANWVITGMAMERDIPIANPMLFMQMKEHADSGKKRQPATMTTTA